MTYNINRGSASEQNKKTQVSIQRNKEVKKPLAIETKGSVQIKIEKQPKSSTEQSISKAQFEHGKALLEGSTSEQNNKTQTSIQRNKEVKKLLLTKTESGEQIKIDNNRAKEKQTKKSNEDKLTSIKISFNEKKSGKSSKILTQNKKSRFFVDSDEMEEENSDDIKKKAEEGDPEAQLEYGKMLFKGNGVEQDKEKAVEYFNKITDQRIVAEIANFFEFESVIDSRAQFEYVKMLLEGRGVKEDKKKVLGKYLNKMLKEENNKYKDKLNEIIENEAKKGNPAAQREYMIEVYETKNEEEAYEYFITTNNEVKKIFLNKFLKLRAKSGDHKAQFLYAIIMLKNKGSKTTGGVIEDRKTALNYLKEAAKGGKGAEVEAFINEYIREKKRNKSIVEYDIKLLYLGVKIIINEEKAIEYIKSKAEKRDPVAQFKYGKMLFEGDGVEQNRGKGVFYIKNAADQNVPEAQFKYGKMLFEGDGVEQNKEEAVTYIKKAANGRNSKNNDAALYYGILLSKGEGVERNVEKALEFFHKIQAKDRGYDTRALEHLRNMLLDKKNTKEEYCKILKLYVKTLIIASDSNGENVSKELEFLKEIADSGNPVAQFEYGKILTESSHKIVKANKEIGLKYLQMAIDQGNVEAKEKYKNVVLHDIKNCSDYEDKTQIMENFEKYYKNLYYIDNERKNRDQKNMYKSSLIFNSGKRYYCFTSHHVRGNSEHSSAKHTVLINTITHNDLHSCIDYIYISLKEGNFTIESLTKLIENIEKLKELEKRIAYAIKELQIKILENRLKYLEENKEMYIEKYFEYYKDATDKVIKRINEKINKNADEEKYLEKLRNINTVIDNSSEILEVPVLVGKHEIKSKEELLDLLVEKDKNILESQKKNCELTEKKIEYLDELEAIVKDLLNKEQNKISKE